MPATAMELAAYAKVNLFLRVVGKRPDGYHELELVFQTLALKDRLYLEPREDGAIELVCAHPHVPAGGDNLAVRAAELLRQTCGVDRGVTIFLEKRIPVAAGLGGGSTDAAAVLKGLNRAWGLGLDASRLQELALALGADVPFCLTGGTFLGRGVGEILTRLPDLPPLPVVLAKPPVMMSTAQIFQFWSGPKPGVIPDLEGLLDAISSGDPRAIGARMANELEEVSGELYPEIGRLQQYMREQGALGSMMTGSGPAVFALLQTEREAEALAQSLRRDFPGLWVEITQTIQPSGAARGRCR